MIPVQANFRAMMRLGASPTNWLCLFLGGALAAALTLAWRTHHSVSKPQTEKTNLAPWGRLEVKTLLLEKPPELLPDANVVWQPTRWHFAARTRSETLGFLATCDLTEEQRTALASPDMLLERADGCWITPNPQTVLALSPDAREKIYAELEKSPQNLIHQHPFTVSSIEAPIWFSRVGLATNKVNLIRQLTYRHGRGVAFCDTEVARHFLEPAEFHALLRALASTCTIQLRLRIKPGDPIDKLAAYWGHGERAATVKRILLSLAQLPDGGELDVEELLPSLPRSWLYTYPKNPRPGETAGDCFWTSLNFFRAEAEPRFLEPSFRNAAFREHYEPIPKAEQLGDIMVFVDDKGSALHACTFIADDIVFTKNGAQARHPWVLMRMEDVRAIYQGNPSAREIVFRQRSS